MNTFTIERRKNTDSPWQATTRVIEAESANDALRQFGLRDAFASDRVKVAKGGKTGREYRAVRFLGQPEEAVTVNDKPAKVKVEAPYGLKTDGTPKAKPGRKPGSEMTVTSAHSDKPSDKPVYTREMRLANLAKGRAKRAENIAKRNGSAPKQSVKEREAAELLARLDALTAEVNRLGIKL